MKAIYDSHFPWLLGEAMRLGQHKPNKDRIGVTDLIDPPRIRELKRRHWDDPDFTINVTHNVAALLGSGFHDRVQKGLEKLKIVPPLQVQTAEGLINFDPTKLLIEQKLEMPYAHLANVMLVGRFDVWYDGYLPDWKTGKAFTLVKDPNATGYVAQPNIYAYMLKKLRDLDTHRVSTVFALKNFEWRKSLQQEDYPETETLEVPQPLWELDETAAFIQQRLALHRLHQFLPEEEFAECTEDERWESPTQHAVFTKKKGSQDFKKVASRVLGSFMDAVDWVNSKGLSVDDVRFDKRPGEPIRCQPMFCDAFQVCPLGQALREKSGVPVRTK